MAERIDNLKYETPTLPSTREPKETFFLTGPAEFLCHQIAEELRSSPVWSRIFGDWIDGYKRMDYPERGLPALRIYNDTFVKENESWFITGDVKMDMIFPANIRRVETQQIPDTLCGAIIQQFRRPSFFHAIRARVPGLNELGKVMTCDKALAFEWQEDILVPLIQITLNMRLDIRQWDRYIEEDYRTVDEPFSRPLGDLESIFTTIEALREDGATGTVEVTIFSEQTIEQ